MSATLVVELPLSVTRRNSLRFPGDHQIRTQGCPVGSQVLNHFGGLTIVSQCEPRVALLMKAWMDDICPPDPNHDPPIRATLYGCFSLTTRSFRIDRKFVGVTAYFHDAYDAVQFKLCWCEYMENI
jgi:hypothetical protein